MDETITKKQAIEAISTANGVLYWNNTLKASLIKLINEIPSAQPKRGRWEWIEEHGRYECSECGERADDLIMGYPRWNFCPHCGADMREVTT